MDKVIRPNVPQWERKPALENVQEDRTLYLAERLMNTLLEEVDPTVVQLAALRLVQKAIIGNYQSCMGAPDTKEVLSQAAALAAQYAVRGIDETTKL
jgi:hypothetical protein